MGVNSPHYVGSTWPSNEGSYNWDTGLLSSWNACLSSAFGRWGNAGRGSWAPRFGRRGGVEREPPTVFLCWRGIRRVPRASRLRRGLQAVCLSTEVVLRCGIWALHLGIAVVLRRGLRALCLGIGGMLGRRLWALHLGISQVALISLTSKASTLLSDDLSSVIFRQFTELPSKFSKLRGWLGRVSKYFGLSFWQQALKTGPTIFWDILSLIFSGFWSSWVYCWTLWSHQRWSSWASRYAV